ncbi:MAG TPA: neocarzinostatin apoprotein domain-containing protein, partial [Acidimicrobiales bacterium]|nr:neocarzinostatin apoprotein domain-containing protein [Acidimicrobiales bacterium]
MRAAGRISMVAAALVLVAAGTVTPTQAPAAAQQAGPTVTVEPAVDLVDGTRVTIDVSGMQPHASVYVTQCTADADDVFEHCAFSDLAFGDTDGSGHARLSLKVDALLALGDGTQGIDCRPSACAIGVISEQLGLAAAAPLHFDSDAPLAPPPTLTVTPDDGLTDLQTVEIRGSGLVWSDFARVAQCAAAPINIFDCDFETVLDVDTMETDSFTADFRVSAAIFTENRDFVDCREPGACVLALMSSESTSAAKSAVVPLAFDPDTELIVGTITVTPDTDLVDGQTVSVAGTGFPADRHVSFYVCASDRPGDGCQWTPNFATVDAAGTFHSDVVVSAVVPTDGGEVDCRTAGTCVLVAAESSPSSPRGGRAPLHFDPDAPLLPGPEIELDPSTDLPDEATVSVSGSHFTPDGDVSVMVCRTGSDFEGCDPQADTFLSPDGSGAFTTELGVAARFESWEGEGIDCREGPGCEVVVEDWVRQRRATAPLMFAPLEPPGPSARRYIDPVFDEVEITHDVVYRDTVDANGGPVQLTLDVYEPAGDKASARPAVVWMHGGWFADGDKADMADYAEAFARRGYVAVSMEYRMRPDLHCCPTRDAMGITEALVDGREDAMAGLEWLHDHAGDYRIDPRAVAVGGDGAGAANAFGLAFTAEPPDHPGGGHAMLQQEHEGDRRMLAAALPISGVSLDRPAEGAPPVLAFHGTEDSLAPLHLTEANCARAEAAGSRCDAVAYEGAWNDIAFTRQRDIIRRSVDFLAKVVLEPLGYFQQAQHPTTTTTTVGSAGPTTTAVTSPVAPQGRGTLPRTGSDAWPLLWAGFGLAGLGIAALVTRHVVTRRRRGAVGATLLVVALLGGLMVPHDAAATVTGGAPGDPTTTTSQATTSTTLVDTPPADPAPDTPGVTEPEPAPEQPAPTPTAPGDPAADQPAPGDMPPPATGVEDPGDPGHDPRPGEFPDDWTPDQVAFANQLIADTEEALERYRNPAILGLLGYVWITDGTRLDGYQHWINTGWIGDQHTLNPEFPESLVFRNAADGPVLEAAMYMLGLGHTMDSIPEDIA